jgi:hypothetical protein
MPSFVSEHSEPHRKRYLLEKRLRRLRAAVKAGEGSIQIASAAEKVRLAALALIKAKRALLKEYPQRDPNGRQALNLQEEEKRWLSLPIEAIIAQHARVSSP